MNNEGRPNSGPRDDHLTTFRHGNRVGRRIVRLWPRRREPEIVISIGLERSPRATILAASEADERRLLLWLARAELDLDARARNWAQRLLDRQR